MYNLLLFIHVLGAIVWVGGTVLAWATGRHLRAAAPENLAGYLRQMNFAAGRVFAPASLVLATAGVVMTVMRWSFTDLWILLGIVGLLYVGYSGARRLDPASNEIAALIEERGHDDPAVQVGVDKLLSMIRIDVLVMVAVVALMTLKPAI
jgi:hypothetical protein